MFNKLFDEKLQIDMTNFFANELSKKGIIKKYKRKECISLHSPDNIYIVLSGDVNQMIISKAGDEVLLYRLQRGTIFGEMDFFEGHSTHLIAKVINDCKVSIVSRAVLEQELIKKPEIYNYFIHSIIRKYRILMLNIADFNFNNSLGKVANSILRLAYTTKYKYNDSKEHNIIDLKITHEELANRIGCDRSTVTSAFKHFKSNELIEVKDKKIFIKDRKRLENYVNYYWE